MEILCSDRIEYNECQFPLCEMWIIELLVPRSTFLLSLFYLLFAVLFTMCMYPRGNRINSSIRFNNKYVIVNISEYGFSFINNISFIWQFFSFLVFLVNEDDTMIFHLLHVSYISIFHYQYQELYILYIYFFGKQYSSFSQMFCLINKQDRR